MQTKSIFDSAINVTKSRSLYTTGEASSCFYYILAGHVDLYEDLDRTKIFLDKKTVFSIVGLDDFVSKKPRSHSAVATDGSDFLRIDNSNFEDFSSQLPDVVLKILNELSCDIKNLNDLLLLKRNEIYDDICQGTVDFIIDNDNEDIRYVSSTRSYPVLLPRIQKEYLYDIERTCPICQNNFKSNNIRLSHLKYLSEDSDLRVHYEDISPLWYQLLTCPKCTYVNFRQSFDNIKPYLKDSIKKVLKKESNFEPKSIKLTINDVFDEHYHFLKVIDSYKYSSLVKSRIWETLIWLYNDVGDEKSSRLAKENYSKSLKEGWYSDSEDLSPEKESLLTYKVGLLEFELGNLKEAYSFCMRASQIKGISPSHKKRVQSTLYEISKLYRSK